MQERASVSRKDRSAPKIVEQIVEAPRLILQEFILSPAEDNTDGNHRLAPQKRSESAMTEDEPSERGACRASASSCEHVRRHLEQTETFTFTFVCRTPLSSLVHFKPALPLNKTKSR